MDRKEKKIKTPNYSQNCGFELSNVDFMSFSSLVKS